MKIHIIHSPGVLSMCAVLALTLTACQTQPRGAAGDSTVGTTCLKGASVGAIGGVLTDLITGKGNGRSTTDRLKQVATGMAVGCAVNLAVTAVGKLLTDPSQQGRYEEAMERDSRRRALEQEKYARAGMQIRARPVSTPQQAASRDAELVKLQKEYEASMAQPVVENLGGGATATIEGQAPTVGGEFNGCQTKTVLVNTPAGQARQQEMHCPDATGVFRRVDARPA